MWLSANHSLIRTEETLTFEGVMTLELQRLSVTLNCHIKKQKAVNSLRRNNCRRFTHEIENSMVHPVSIYPEPWILTASYSRVTAAFIYQLSTRWMKTNEY